MWVHSEDLTWQLQVYEAADPPPLFSMLYFTWFSILLPLSLSPSSNNPPIFPCGWAWNRRGWVTLYGWYAEDQCSAALFCIPQLNIDEYLVGRDAKWDPSLPDNFSGNAVLWLHFCHFQDQYGHHWLACPTLDFLSFQKMNKIRRTVRCKDPLWSEDMESTKLIQIRPWMSFSTCIKNSAE